MVEPGETFSSQERNDGLSLEVWNHSHANTAGPLTSFLHCDQDERRKPPFELPTSSQTGLLAANPRLINLYLTVQWLETHSPSPGGVYEASSIPSRSWTDQADAATARRIQSWSGGGLSPRSAKLGGDSLHIVAVSG